ncbi:hypothetical protein pipiens_005003, partial [Culex pipiens pipiens]
MSFDNSLPETEESLPPSLLAEPGPAHLAELNNLTKRFADQQ